jgi:hypothetical protein
MTNTMIEEMAKEAIGNLEKSVGTCDSNVATYAALSATLIVGLEKDKTKASEEGEKALKKVSVLTKEFADKCTCTKK